MSPYRCSWCTADLEESEVYNYGGEKAHTMWSPLPYFSSESAGLPCGPVSDRSAAEPPKPKAEDPG